MGHHIRSSCRNSRVKVMRNGRSILCSQRHGRVKMHFRCHTPSYTSFIIYGWHSSLSSFKFKLCLPFLFSLILSSDSSQSIIFVVISLELAVFVVDVAHLITSGDIMFLVMMTVSGNSFIYPFLVNGSTRFVCPCTYASRGSSPSYTSLLQV